jgi:RsiW-degrading membrane proteinase PrsW (M82 family)
VIAHALVSLALALLPVLVFLLALVLLDSYKLLPWDRVVRQLVFGALAAIASIGVNRLLLGWTGADTAAFARYLAPAVEELLKGSIVVALLFARRFGFLVDAAICGFAVGAGFAAFENIHYFRVLGDTSPVLWTIRGFGTAIMHGSVTAITAVAAKALSDRRGGPSAVAVAPGWLFAMLLHSAFNHFFLSPNVSTAVLLLVLPGFFAAVFRVSESRTREWLGAGFDSDQELLAAINSGRVAESRVGRYLEELKARFPGTVVVDMLCLLRLRLELSIRAKGIMIMRKAGFDPGPDPTFNERFAELKYLEKSIGPTGVRALAPILSISDRDLWQYHMLTKG